MVAVVLVDRLPDTHWLFMRRPEKRIDVLTGRISLVAPGRSARPIQATTATAPENDQEFDPFLQGHESETPAESLALRKTGTAADSQGWLLRVVPNRYPAVVANDADSSDDSAHGVHEVVIECPDMKTQLVDFSVTEIARTLTSWQLRINRLMSDPRLRSIHVFRNEGSKAGASLKHSHSQIIALDFVPPDRQQGIFAAKSQSHAEQIANSWQQQQKDRDLDVFADDDFFVTCPFSSRVSQHVRLCPSKQWNCFHTLAAASILKLASLIKAVCEGLQNVLGRHDFNLVLQQPSNQSPVAGWFLDVLPRTAQFAGFELGSAVEIITIAPEDAAKQLRRAWKLESSHQKVVPDGYQWIDVADKTEN